MFTLYEKVKIKKSGIIGTIVDISNINEKKVFVVESNKKNINTGYGGTWKLFDCAENEIEKY
ncbi:MAG: hypothetical protein LUE12_06355 [Ruminococcus sp.]|nr:hypothetical protein [Ruminococcus sp.]